MGFIPQITCRHCGNEYSGVRNRCPNCGTRRVQSSTRTASSTDGSRQGTSASAVAAENTKWQFILGIVLLVAVIISVIILIAASTGGNGNASAEISPSPVVESEAPSDSPTPALPSPSPSPLVEVTSISVTFLGSKTVEFTMAVGEEIQLKAQIYPLDSEGTVTWSSANDGICTVDSTGLVTGVAPGWGSVIAECAGVKTVVDVQVKQSW